MEVAIEATPSWYWLYGFLLDAARFSCQSSFS
jgi:hypothetical protein